MPAITATPDVMSPSTREDLALAIAYAFRNALENLHADSAKTGMSDNVMKFINRRAARRAYELLEGKSVDDALAFRKWEQWVDEMWTAAVTNTNLSGVVNVPPPDLYDAYVSAFTGLLSVKSTLQMAVKLGLSFRELAQKGLIPMIPTDWDSPAIPVENIRPS